MYKSLVQCGPLVVQKVSEQLRSVLLARSYISGEAQPSWKKHRLGGGKRGGGVLVDKHNGMTSPGEGSLPRSTIMYKGQRSKLDSCGT